MKTNIKHKRQVLLAVWFWVCEGNEAMFANAVQNIFISEFKIPKEKNQENQSLICKQVHVFIVFPFHFLCTKKHLKTATVSVHPLWCHKGHQRVCQVCDNTSCQIFTPPTRLPLNMRELVQGTSLNRSVKWDALWKAENRGLNMFFNVGQLYLFGWMIMFRLLPRSPGLYCLKKRKALKIDTIRDL